MADITASWLENQAVETLDTATITQGNAATGDIDLADLGYIGVKVQITITCGAAVDADPTIEVFGSANSGTTDDTIPIWSQSVTFGGVKTISFTIMNEPYIAIKVTNTTSADGDEDLDLVAKYAGLKYASA